MVFDQDAQVEQVGHAGAAPKLSAPAMSALELLAEGFDGAAAHGRTGLLHRLVMEMSRVLLKVMHFPGDGCPIGCGTPRAGRQEFLQLVNHLGFLAVAQALEDGLQPLLGGDRPGPWSESATACRCSRA